MPLSCIQATAFINTLLLLIAERYSIVCITWSLSNHHSFNNYFHKPRKTSEMEPANHRYQVLGIPGKTSSNCLKVLIHTDKGPRGPYLCLTLDRTGTKTQE